MITPVIGHTTCHLDQQRRLIDARSDGAARRARALRPRGPWSALRRLVGTSEPRRRGHAQLDLGSRGEDVWQALRY